MNSLIAPERLDSLLKPRAVALVGASDKSQFSRIAFHNLTQFGFAEHTYLVNPRTAVVHDRATVASCAQIEEPTDLALVMVPQAAMLDALTEAAEAGVRNAVVLSAGYGEAGSAGRAAQQRLAEHAAALDMLVLGPNILGFVNVVDQIPVIAVPELSQKVGSVALLSQSGGSISAMSQFAQMVDVDFSYLVTLGNEAMITAGDVLDYLVDDESTRAIAMFIESIRSPERFSAAAKRALAADKPIVVLKAGSSALAGRTASAHTGAFVGDDAVTEAIFAELGIIRVTSIEDLIITAGAAARIGPMKRSGVAIVTASGGACDIIADLAAAEGMELPEMSPAVTESLVSLLPDFALPLNPLDVTGAGLNNPALLHESIVTMGDDPRVGVVAIVNSLPWTGPGPNWPRWGMARAIGAGMAECAVPTVFINQIVQPISDVTRAIGSEVGIPWVLPGMAQAVRALAGIASWSKRVGRSDDDVRGIAPEIERLRGVLDPQQSPTEAQVADLMAKAGIRVVESVVARTEDEAAAAAGALGGPFAVKVLSPDIAHKSDIGGVRLGVTGEFDVRSAFRSVVAAAQRVDGARVEGAVISSMLPPATELLLGVVRDADWGLVLAIAFGGVFTEVMNDSVLVPLPTSAARIRESLERMRGFDILTGARGAKPADLYVLVETALRLTDLAMVLGDDLESLEINPLRVDGDEVQALDALLTWRPRLDEIHQ